MEVQRQISYSFRISEHLMAQANQIAAENDEKMAQVIRKAIRAYIDAEKNQKAQKNKAR